MNEPQVGEITSTLDRISKILAGILLKDLDELDQAKKILRLRSCGFGNKEIAEMLNTTPGTVQVTMSQMKSKKRGAGRPKKKK